MPQHHVGIALGVSGDPVGHLRRARLPEQNRRLGVFAVTPLQRTQYRRSVLLPPDGLADEHGQAPRPSSLATSAAGQYRASAATSGTRIWSRETAISGHFHRVAVNIISTTNRLPNRSRARSPYQYELTTGHSSPMPQWSSAATALTGAVKPRTAAAACISRRGCQAALPPTLRLLDAA